VLVLSRQGLRPVDRRHSGEPSSVHRGGYRVAGNGVAQVTLLASGSEVGIAIEARTLLAEAGIRAAVVSMPSLELFAEQPDDYRRDILGTAPRIVIEASIAQSWATLTEPGDRTIAMTGFGASAPAGDLYERFGITAQRVRDEAFDVVHTCTQLQQGAR